MNLVFSYELCDKKIVPIGQDVGQYQFLKEFIDNNCGKETTRVLKVTIKDLQLGDKTTKKGAGSNAVVVIGMQYSSQPIVLP